MPLHLERESHQNCKQDPVGLKFLKCAPFFCFVNRRDILHTSLSTHTPRSLITPLSPQVPHFHRNSPLSHHTTHSPILLLFTTQHTLHSPLSHHTLSTLSPHIPYSHTTQSPPSHHTNLSAHTPVCHYKLLQFSFLPHHTLSILSTHHTPPTFTSKHSLTTHSHYHFTPHTPHSLNTPHTPNSLTTPHITNSLTAYSPLSHFTLPTIVPLSHPTPYSLTLPHHPDCFTTHPNFSPHFLLSYQSHFASHSPLSHHTPHYFTSLHTLVQVSNLIPHSRTSLCYRTFPLSLRSPLFHHTPPFLAILLTLISSHPQFLTLNFPISLLILSHHHPCPQGGHWDERWGCGMWALYTGKIFAHVLFSLSPALSAGNFRTGRIPMFQLFSLVHKCDFKTRRNCLQA